MTAPEPAPTEHHAAGHPAPVLLHVQDLHAYYGDSRVLSGVALTVRAGEAVTLLGRNGMGKTTTIRSVLGLVPRAEGVVVFDGAPILGRPTHLIARAGIGLVPEGRQIFPNLTVAENLRVCATSGAWTLDRVYGLFPRLTERHDQSAGSLSGGEQQMLAIGRALMTNPKLLILDEATEGLAPLIRQEIWACLATLKAAGQAILVVDKNVAALMRFADRHVMLEKGRVVWQGTTEDLRADPKLTARYLGV